MDFARRFGGVARLYGDQGLSALAAASVCVVGVGGVGSWTVEALARSAVGHITLIDMDHVAESNMNRQLPAIEAELGRAKVAVLRDRIASINPSCEVTLCDAFVTTDNVAELIAVGHQWVIDCIDNFRVKAAMIAFCRRRRQSVITVGGAGGQRDASRVRVGDLRRTEQDPLLARTRKLLRHDYGFPTNPKRRFNVPCVWSDEPRVAPPGECDASTEGSLNCAGFGACMPVTATFGLIAAGYVIDQLAGRPGR
ncbi:MAG: tRNA threonylcarbamoyladenosine dehydratase [Chromatiaceae bacterium]|nr:tRNA threonylcarbamoyladenosine dehydratase [Gammaproteobacteria bacterium]MCP5304705.1 tRNA threonylcarbamoyladenosine dehydratase [Chromatiaceae bacterium]MCP5314432.1 tRNA threonylcarbamoyladenosine dehydratase [Chromatiaceae bacterium]